MRVHFPSPRLVIWMDFPIRSAPFPPHLEFWKEGKAFSNQDLAFPFPMPWEIWRGSRKCWRALVSLQEQPVATHNHHYRSTIYENKANMCLFRCLPFAYQWCSVHHSSPLGIHICHLYRSRAQCSGGGTRAGHKLRLSSPLHSGRLPRCRRRECHSLLSTLLEEKQ